MCSSDLDRERAAESFRDADIVARLFDGAYQHRGMALKLASGRCEGCAGFIPNEQYAAEVALEGMNSRADCRLADVQLIRGADKVSCRNDRQEGSCKLGIHTKAPGDYIDSADIKNHYYSVVKTNYGTRFYVNPDPAMSRGRARKESSPSGGVRDVDYAVGSSCRLCRAHGDAFHPGGSARRDGSYRAPHPPSSRARRGLNRPDACQDRLPPRLVAVRVGYRKGR